MWTCIAAVQPMALASSQTRARHLNVGSTSRDSLVGGVRHPSRDGIPVD